MGGTGVQGVVQLVVMMALGRLLTPADFGLMGAAVIVIALSQIVSQVGVGPAIVQRRELDTVHLRTAFTISGVLGFVLGGAVWLTAPALAAFYRMPDVEPVLKGLALLFPIDSLNTVGESLLTRQLRFRLYVALDLVTYLVGYAIVGVLLAWQGYGVWALVAANLARMTLRTLAMYFATKHPIRPGLSLKASRDLLSFGFGHSLGQIGIVLSQQGDNLVVGRWLGATALGLYGRAYNLMVMPASVFGRIVNRVLFPVMAQVQDEPRRLGGAYERASAIVALVSLPVSACLWVVAPEFIRVVLGPAWDGVVMPFRFFSISLLFRMSSKVSDACTKAAGAVYSRAIQQGAYAVMVVLGALIGKGWGPGGVAIAVSVAMCVNWLGMAALCRSVTDVSWGRFALSQVPGVLFALLTGVAVALTAAAARSLHLGSFGVLIVAGLTATGVLLLSKLQPKLLLGPHGAWALRQTEAFLRQGIQHLRRMRSVQAKDLAEVNSK
jgi:PST family polysaccharide transporter